MLAARSVTTTSASMRCSRKPCSSLAALAAPSSFQKVVLVAVSQLPHLAAASILLLYLLTMTRTCTTNALRMAVRTYGILYLKDGMPHLNLAVHATGASALPFTFERSAVLSFGVHFKLDRAPQDLLQELRCTICQIHTASFLGSLQKTTQCVSFMVHQ